jgi:hypothetical protein
MSLGLNSRDARQVSHVAMFSVRSLHPEQKSSYLPAHGRRRAGRQKSSCDRLATATMVDT